MKTPDGRHWRLSGIFIIIKIFVSVIISNITTKVTRMVVMTNIHDFISNYFPLITTNFGNNIDQHALD